MTAQHPVRAEARAEARRRILVVTSNGSGMGHLTRMLAVATRMSPETDVTFASLSTGVSVVGRYDMPYEYISSPSALNMGWTAWEGYLHGRLSLLLDALEPDTLVFDGTQPYRGLLRAMEGRDLRAVWMRRGMWLPNVGEGVLERGRHFDQIIEPGELAADHDAGVTAGRDDAAPVPPITLLSDEQLLTRHEARRELGYDEGEDVALVTLGAGNINDTSSLQETILDWFRRELPDWRVVVTRSPITRGRAQDARTHVETLREYPLARFARAFDVVVSACGYNAFHEWHQAGIPALWVPNTETATDDQLARGRWASETGTGLLHRPTCDDRHAHADLEQQLARLTDDGIRAELARRCAEVTSSAGGPAAEPGGDGAAQAARLILGDGDHETARD